MKYCKNCGWANEDSSKFCSSCGSKLEELKPQEDVVEEENEKNEKVEKQEEQVIDVTVKERECPVCGCKIDDDTINCPVCGALVDNHKEVVQKTKSKVKYSAVTIVGFVLTIIASFSMEIIFVCLVAGAGITLSAIGLGDAIKNKKAKALAIVGLAVGVAAIFSAIIYNLLYPIFKEMMDDLGLIRFIMNLIRK